MLQLLGRLPDYAVALIVFALAGLAWLGWFVYRSYGWIIGPIIKGKNYSHGLPLRPRRTSHGWRFNLDPGDEVDGVTTSCFGLPAGTIRLRFRVTGSLPTTLFAVEHPDKIPALSLFFQRWGDDWSGGGRYETYRWYSKTLYPIHVGEELVVELPLTPEYWKAVMSTQGNDDPGAFNEARRKAWRVGLVFGSAGGRSHGISTSAPVTFELLDWTVA